METHREHAMPDEGAPVGPVAGETLKDPASWPGHTLIAVGLLAFALSLTGFAVGRSGFATAGDVVAVLALSAGVGWLVAEHRRLRADDRDHARASGGRRAAAVRICRSMRLESNTCSNHGRMRS